MNKFKCKKCGFLLEENETYLAMQEGKISMDPQNPDKQASFPQPIRRHKGVCDGAVELEK